MAFLVTTTGTANPVVITDLNGLSIAHPTIDLELELQFTAQELSESSDLQTALDDGELTAKDADSIAITDVSQAIAGSHKHTALSILYNNTTSGLTAIDVQAALDEIDGSLDSLAISDLTDVTITTPSNGQVLTYSGGIWVNSAVPSAPVTSVNGATGIVVLDTDDIAEGATNLYYTETRVSANTDVTANTAKVSASGSIDTHSDVDTTTATPNSGDVLKFNGSNWVPGSDIAGAVDSVFGRTGAVVAVSGDYTASEVDYVNTTSSLTATDVQAAIDEVEARIDTIESATYVNSFEGRTGTVTAQSGDYLASEITYANGSSGLTATQVQAAIDEVEARVDTNDAKISADGSIDTHSDVDVTTSSPSSDDLLQFDGSNWVPVASTSIQAKRNFTLSLKRGGVTKNDYLRHSGAGNDTSGTPWVVPYSSAKLREVMFSSEDDLGASAVLTLNIYSIARGTMADVTTADTLEATITSGDGGVIFDTGNGARWKIDVTASNITLADTKVYAFRMISSGSNVRDANAQFVMEEV